MDGQIASLAARVCVSGNLTASDHREGVVNSNTEITRIAGVGGGIQSIVAHLTAGDGRL